MNMEVIASEYLNSALVIKSRINELRTMQKTKNFKNQKKIEDRIILLNAEYYYLVNSAAYLKNYYNKTNNASLLEVKWDKIC